MRVQCTLNGKSTTLEFEPADRLLDTLRYGVGLTGTKEGCGEGECGACTVLVDGEPVNSCLVAVCSVRGASVTTIEGAGLESIQEAFLAEGGAQCGICTPGLIVMTRAWLDAMEAKEGDQPLRLRDDLEILQSSGLKTSSVLWLETREAVTGGFK